MKICLVCKNEYKERKESQKYCSWKCKNIGVNKSRIPNLINKKIEKLIVLSYIGSSSHGSLWKCLCVCGNQIIRTTSSLTGKRHIRSCGCLRHDGSKRLLPNGEASFNYLYSAYTHQAKRRNLIFNIDKDIFRNITSSPCYYCGCFPSSGEYRRRKNYPVYLFNGLDRIDNNVGYTKENIVPCCEMCNKMKHKYSKTEFLNRVSKIYYNCINKNLCL